MYGKIDRARQRILTAKHTDDHVWQVEPHHALILFAHKTKIRFCRGALQSTYKNVPQAQQRLDYLMGHASNGGK